MFELNPVDENGNIVDGLALLTGNGDNRKIFFCYHADGDVAMEEWWGEWGEVVLRNFNAIPDAEDNEEENAQG